MEKQKKDKTSQELKKMCDNIIEEVFRFKSGKSGKLRNEIENVEREMSEVDKEELCKLLIDGILKYDARYDFLLGTVINSFEIQGGVKQNIVLNTCRKIRNTEVVDLVNKVNIDDAAREKLITILIKEKILMPDAEFKFGTVGNNNRIKLMDVCIQMGMQNTVNNLLKFRIKDPDFLFQRFISIPKGNLTTLDFQIMKREISEIMRDNINNVEIVGKCQATLTLIVQLESKAYMENPKWSTGNINNDQNGDEKSEHKKDKDKEDNCSIF